MEASCSTMKVLVSSMECPRINAQRTGAMKRTKLNGSFFVMTVATTMRIKINAMIKVAFINKSFRFINIYYRVFKKFFLKDVRYNLWKISPE